MENFVIIVVLAAVIGFAVWYVIKAKRSGKRCIGCPDSASCQARNGSCGCGGCSESK